MRRFLKISFVILVVLVGLAPVSIVITLFMMPLWAWIELNYQIESIGHAAPAEWCFVATYAVLVAVSLATLALLTLTDRKRAATSDPSAGSGPRAKVEGQVTSGNSKNVSFAGCSALEYPPGNQAAQFPKNNFGGQHMKKTICMAILGSALFAASAFAADADEQAIRSNLTKATENWSAMNVDANDAYYAPDANAAWFDIAPLKYVGWNEYKAGVKKLFADFQSFSLKLNDDMAVERRGKVAWVTYTFSSEIRMKDGKAEKGEGRGTDILEKRGGKWVIVHEHVSFPAPM